ncbi:MAG: hypothetical protein K5764_05355 [Prevotella sp.]|nr:hypothetical protein [Prevotella sp.]
MKKLLSIVLLALTVSSTASAQNTNEEWTVNTRVWTTNYFTALIYDLAGELVKHYAFVNNPKDSILAERIIASSDLVFPIGMGKSGFSGEGDIYSAYHYALGTPFKRMGDWAVGVDVSYRPSAVGFYAGAYFKSQEIVFKHDNENLRGYYIQPRAGLIVGGESLAFEAGVFYDMVTGCGGSVAVTEKDRLKGGLGLDFGISAKNKDGSDQYVLQFSMPLHNFLNPDYAGQQGMERKVGYIVVTRRIFL